MKCAMKKMFPLHAPGKADARVLDAIKHEVRKYTRREHRKPLPEGYDRLEFDCRIGTTAADATLVSLKDASATLDAVAKAGGSTAYVEIAARPAQRRAFRTGSPL